MALTVTAAGIATFTAAAVATSTIDNIVTRAFNCLDEYRKTEGMEAVRARLEQTRPQIEAVLLAVEREKIKEQNKALDAWLWQLRDAVDEADDVIDEIEYYELEKKVKSNEKKVGSALSKYKEKVKKLVKPGPSGEILKRLRDAVKGLDKVASGVTNFLQLVQLVSKPECYGGGYQHGQSNSSRETSALLTENVVYGREKERKMIIDWLIKPVEDGPKDGTTNISAFTIVGMGGLGKTTLAQLICDDKRVKEYFSLVRWVCVSDNGVFDLVATTKRILEAMKGDPDSTQTLSILHDKLKEKVMSERYLLVLDDVWNDNRADDWEKVLAPLKCGKRGSMILFTTRMKSVASMMAKVFEGRHEDLILHGLSEKDYLTLFNKHAFGNANPDDYQNLQVIGNEIVKKLGGSPLAAKVMGRLLNSRMDSNYWRCILDEDIIDIEEGQRGIMQVLKLSYYHLPACLQHCFRFCSIFPQDYPLEKEKIVPLWIASGLVQQPENGRKSPEDVGGEIWDQLIQKSFFESEGKFYCIMHDLLHDLARLVSLGECLSINHICIAKIPNTVRHLYIVNVDFQVLSKLVLPKNLRTLLITKYGSNPKWNQGLSDFLNGAANLRVLSLRTGFLFSLPDTVGRLVHLRYLLNDQFEETEERKVIDSFPLSVLKLYHLRVLDFPLYGPCAYEKMEVDGLSNLMKLRSLNLATDIVRRIPHIGNLTNLQGLHFSVGKENGYKISELKELRSLNQLEILDIHNVTSCKEATEAKLEEKDKLNKLVLRWSKPASDDLELEDQILDSLRPNRSLQELHIYGFGGCRYPIWVIEKWFTNLTEILLCDCNRLRHLPPITNLPLLEKMTLRNMPALEQAKDGYIFPQLNSFKIRKCPNLMELPCLPSSLTTLKIEDVGLTTLPEIQSPSCNGRGPLSPNPSLTYVYIGNCRDLTSLNGFLQQQPCLKDLKVLYIEGCQKLKHLPDDWFGKLTFLETLALIDCSELVPHGIHSNHLPSSLKRLLLKSCGGIDESLVNSLRKHTSLTELVLEGCENITTHTLAALESTSLRKLGIRNCHKLTEASHREQPLGVNQGVEEGSSWTLDTLCVDELSLLQMEPLRRVCSVKKLKADNCSQLTTLPEQWLLQNKDSLESLYIGNASTLKCLSPSLSNLCSLRTIKLWNPASLESFPNLPSSLQVLCINDNGYLLEELCQRVSNPDWKEIRHIVYSNDLPVVTYRWQMIYGFWVPDV